jgi:molybdopterin adenylyltransferase
MVELADEIGCHVIVTTGGTGPAQRDVTPEATEQVVDRIMPGFGEQMRMISLQYTPTAILSRQTAGVRGTCLIFNLPGRPKSIRETIDEIWKAVPYCVDLIGGPYIDTIDEVCNAFRPKDARRR